MKYVLGMVDKEPGVPLAHYLTHPGVEVQFVCNVCLERTRAPVVEVIERLKATGKGDETTGIRALRWLTDRPCKACGAIDWEVRPWFPKQ
jgi:hypothetical protein